MSQSTSIRDVMITGDHPDAGQRGTVTKVSKKDGLNVATVKLESGMEIHIHDVKNQLKPWKKD